jgi:hypothetical protein
MKRYQIIGSKSLEVLAEMNTKQGAFAIRSIFLKSLIYTEIWDTKTKSFVKIICQ